MTLQELEVRLRTLEDIEEINKLQRAYGYYLEHWEGQHIVELFSNSNNVSVEANRKGVYLGQEGIKYFFLTDKVSPEFLHVMIQLSGIVDVDPGGKTAKGRWYGFGPQAMPIEGVFRALWVLGVYENEYVKEDGKWKLLKIQYSIIFSTPYEDGWVKTPTMPPPQFRRKEGPKTGPSTCYKPYPSGYNLPYHYRNPVSGN